MSTEDQIVPEQATLSDISNRVLSVSWNNGIMGAVYYDLATMELTLVHETFDTKPNYTYLNNLFRQVCPSFLLINGPSTFTSEIIRLLNLSEDFHRSLIQRKQRNKPTNSHIVVSNIDSNKLSYAKTRVLKIKLPGMPEGASESAKLLYLSSVIPLEQSLVVFSITALLDYLQTNFKQLFQCDSLIITNINVCQLENQLLIDLSTLYGLQIFNSSSNSSSKYNKGFLNLYNLLNQCASPMGSNALKEIMMTPVRDLNELKLRLNTVEWFTLSKNFDVVVKFRRHLRKIRNLSLLTKRIIMNMGKAQDIKLFKNSVYNAYLICQEAVAACQTSKMENTLLKLLADCATESRTIKGVLYSLDKVVDLVASEKENRFIVNAGLDVELDQKKETLTAIEKSIYETEQTNRLGLPSFVHDYYLIFMPGVGFVISVEIENRDESCIVNSSTGEPFDVVFQKDKTTLFKTEYCNELDGKYGNLYGDICCHEKRVFDRLVKYLTESLPELIAMNKMCAKLDCLIAFASVALQRQYVKPDIVETRGLYIKQGRHPLIETNVSFVPNDTDISGVNNNLVTILSAPNASGKSVYMKEIALIAYMAHIGSFVPAHAAKIGLLDAIYTRIYCPESIQQDESSFFSDLKQMSQVLLKATSRSLVLIDEFGKGTNIREGQALLSACIENMVGRGPESSITIITTHFHDILRLICNETITLKTIKTTQNEKGYRSLYEIVDGNSRPHISGYAESYAMFRQFLLSGDRSIDVDTSYYTLLIAKFGFARTLLHMYKRDQNLNILDVITLFNKANLAKFIKYK